MYKLFTHEEATRLLPVVDEHLAEMQRGIRDMIALRNRLAGLRSASLEARNVAQEIAFLLSEIHEHKAELDRLGVHVTDVEAGAVDFPSKLGAEVICLTWERGQDGITQYHRLDGSAELLPLPGANDAEFSGRA